MVRHVESLRPCGGLFSWPDPQFAIKNFEYHLLGAVNESVSILKSTVLIMYILEGEITPPPTSGGSKENGRRILGRLICPTLPPLKPVVVPNSMIRTTHGLEGAPGKETAKVIWRPGLHLLRSHPGRVQAASWFESGHLEDMERAMGGLK